MKARVTSNPCGAGKTGSAFSIFKPWRGREVSPYSINFGGMYVKNEFMPVRLPP